MPAELLSQHALNRALLDRQMLPRRAPMPAEARAERVIETVEHLVGLQAQAPFPPYYGLWSRLADFRPALPGRGPASPGPWARVAWPRTAVVAPKPSISPSVIRAHFLRTFRLAALFFRIFIPILVFVTGCWPGGGQRARS